MISCAHCSTSSGLRFRKPDTKKEIGSPPLEPDFLLRYTRAMLYVSTRGGAAPSSFTDIVLQGLAPDGGLFVPMEWPRMEPLSDSDSYTDIAYKVISPFTTGCIPDTALKDILRDTYTTSVFHDPDITPLRQLGNDLFLMELFHGPTLAFKDIALQFLGRVFDYLLEQNGQRITIIGATSGDTGSAAIAAANSVRSLVGFW